MEVIFKGNNQSLQELVSLAFENKKQSFFDKLFKGIPFALIFSGLAMDAGKTAIDDNGSKMVNEVFDKSLFLKSYAYIGGISLLVLLYFKNIFMNYYRSLAASDGTLTQKQIASLKLERLCLFIGSRTGVYLSPEDFKNVVIDEQNFGVTIYSFPETKEHGLKEIHAGGNYQISLISNHRK